MPDLKIAVCVPTAGTVKAWFAYSLAMLMAHGRGWAQRPDVSSLSMTLFMQETSVIHSNRELLVKQSLEWGATHIMFLDDDMEFPPHVLDILLGRRHPVVACNYPKRGWPVTFTAVKPDGSGVIVTSEHSSGLEEAAYTGFGISLFERQVFEKTAKPWFLPKYIAEADMYTTEDNPFFERARAAGFVPYVDHDASKLVGHCGAHTYKWNQALTTNGE